MSEPFQRHASTPDAVNWTDELEQLHEESSRTHFIDVWTRRAMLDRVGPLPAEPTLLDVGCSSGYLLEDMRRRFPDARLIGVDLVAAGLRKAARNVPEATLMQADVRSLPLADATVDAVLSANLLEHVAEDELGLVEIARVLRPGARAVIVVPVGPGNYDYYDSFLEHERRYARGELARKARSSGFEVLEDVHLGAPIYPAFWLAKQRNRRRHGDLRGESLQDRVRSDIARTNDSRVGRLACGLERRLLELGVRLPFGIRGMTVLVRLPERS